MGAECQGGQCELSVGSKMIYRFFWLQNEDADHVFAAATSVAGFELEGESFSLFVGPGPGLIPLYQSYCASCTDHFQTVNDGEGAPTFGQQEVLGYCAKTPIPEASTALFRLHSDGYSNHFVTKSAGEAQAAVTELGYVIESEGICYVP